MSQDTWTLIAEYKPEIDLVVICRQLDYLKIRYRIRRNGHSQELWIADPSQLETVLKVMAFSERSQQQAAAGVEGDESINGYGGVNSLQPRSLADALKRFPVVAATILLGILGALVVRYQFDWVHWLTFQDFTLVEPRIYFSSAAEGFEKGQYWRLLTPVLLHFGVFHIAFNGLWLWELGRRIEWFGGSVHLLQVILITALASNITQYLWDGPSLFGGLSGVVYGLLGYLWIRHKLSPHPATRLPPGILGFMLFWLLICMSGVVSALLGSGVANAAHAGGLLMGMILGAIFGFFARTSPRQL